MSRKIVLMDTIMDAMIELAELNERSVLEEATDMTDSLREILAEIPVDERSPGNWG